MVNALQVTPLSEDILATPELPPAINTPFPYATEFTWVATPNDLVVQVIPSVDVLTAAFVPKITYVPFP